MNIIFRNLNFKENRHLDYFQLTGISLALVVDMNISIPALPEIKSIQQLNTNPDFNPHGKAYSDRFKFDSLINNNTSDAIKSESAHSEGQSENKTEISSDNFVVKNKESEQSKSHSVTDTEINSDNSAVKNNESEHSKSHPETDTEISSDNFVVKNKESEQSAKNTEIDNQSNNLRSEETNSRSTQSERPTKIDNQNNYHRPEEANASLEQSTRYAETDNQINSHSSITISKNSEQSEDHPGSSTASEGGLKAGVILSSLLNEATANSESEQLEDHPGTNTDSENGLKTGALLFSLLNKSISEIVNDSLINNENEAAINSESEQSEDHPGTNTGSENGLKTGAILSSMLNEALVNKDSEHSENHLVSRSGSENALKSDALLLNLLKGQAKALINDKGVSDLAAQMKALNSLNSGHGDSGAIIEELFNQSDENTDDNLNDVKMAQFQNDLEELDLPENNDTVKALNDRLIFKNIKNFNHENGLTNSSENTVKAVRTGTEINNTNLINNSNITYDGGKTNEGMFSANASRSKGFNELLDKIVYVVKGNNRLGVTIEHDNLGKLNINLSLEKGLVNVHINTSDNATREFVENNIQYIVDSLAKNGVNVGGFSVALKNHKENAENVLTMDSEQEKEFIKKPENIRDSSGLINIFV